jgi:tetratricopeptide (TPR) repeat protein
MRLEEYPDYSQEVSAEPDASIEVFHDFEAAKRALIPRGSLVIDSEPPGAAVYLNGSEKGRTRLEMRDLRSADYDMELKLEGYEPLQKRISLLPDENLRISLNLVEKPKLGDLMISSSPAGAEAMLNGVRKGLTPLALHKLPVGEYDLTIRMKGYKPYKRLVVCEKDSTAAIEASLEMTPKLAALKSGVVGDQYARRGELARAAAAYNRALSLDPQSPAYRKKLKNVKRSLLKKEAQNLLSSYEFAYDSENSELLASLLDESDPDFVSDQVENAKMLFDEFDNIDMALSEPKFSLEGPGEIAVELRLSIDADFAETGLSAELLNADRTLILRRSQETGPEATWKICEIK